MLCCITLYNMLYIIYCIYDFMLQYIILYYIMLYYGQPYGRTARARFEGGLTISKCGSSRYYCVQFVSIQYNKKIMFSYSILFFLLLLYFMYFSFVLFYCYSILRYCVKLEVVIHLAMSKCGNSLRIEFYRVSGIQNTSNEYNCILWCCAS
jgi:hypothetical protein